MKLRTLDFYVKEAMSGVYRNKLMSLASLSITTVSLLIVGFFILFSANLNFNIDKIKNKTEMEVILEDGIDGTRISEIESQINSMDMVQRCRLVAKEEALEKIKGILGESEGILEGLEDEGIVPQSFVVYLYNAQDSATVAEWLKSAEGVDQVLYPFETVRKLNRIARIVKTVTAAVILILIVISTFIISNTIKLTVFARRKEINIMKYIGATDSFIRWPFVIEGILIGFIGCLAAFIVVAYSYKQLLNSNFVLLDSFSLMPFENINNGILIAFLFVGVGIGALGSAVSIRKYLYV